MERPSVFGAGPPTPSPPLALSDLLAQRPFPPYTPPYERPITSPETALGELDEQSMQVVASGNETQASPAQQDKPEIRITVAPKPAAGSLPPSFCNAETQTAPVIKSAPPSTADWLAKRNQLRPHKHQGSKADWVRGWSEGVGAHGQETYCACSESSSVGDWSLGSRGSSSAKAGLRAILRVKRPIVGNGLAGTKATAGSPEPDICANCSRMPSPPVTATSSLDGGEPELQTKGSLATKINGLLQRARPGRRKETGGSQSPTSMPQGQIAFGTLQHPAQDPQAKSGPTSTSTREPVGMITLAPVGPNLGRKPHQAEQSQDSDNIATASPAAVREHSKSTPSPSGISSSSDKPRGDGGITRRMSRLQRAATLLRRAERSN